LEELEEGEEKMSLFKARKEIKIFTVRVGEKTEWHLLER
jgi:hypothetical protein